MVTRVAPFLLALLLAGCPDDVGQGGAVTVGTPLLAPTDLAGSADGETRMVLSWTDRATNETGYRLEMNLSPFGSSIVADVRLLAAGTTGLVYPTTAATTYYFRLFAVTATLESEQSDILQVTSPPAQPAGVLAESNGPTWAGVVWQDVAGETEYLIERSSDSGMTWTSAGTVPADTISFLSAGLNPDTEYLHRVVAVNSGGRSTPSVPASAQTTTDKVTFQFLPTAANNGVFTSLIARDPAILHIAHYDLETTGVSYSSRFGTLSPWVTVLADGGSTGIEDVGGDGTSLAVEGVMGTPVSQRKAHLVSHDRTSGVLRYATDASGLWVRTPVDAGGGARPKIVRDPASGALHVAYQGRASGGGAILRHARKLPGQGWTLRDFFSAPLDPGVAHSLALDAAGRPHVVLVTATGGLVHVWEGATGAIASLQVIYPAAHGPADYTALAIDPDGTIHVIYRGSLSRSLHHLPLPPGSAPWNPLVIDEAPGEDLGSFCAAVVDEVSGWLHVAYYDATRRDLRCATKGPGTAWVRRIIDVSGDVGSHVSVASVWGTTLYFAYRDETQKRIKVAVKEF